MARVTIKQQKQIQFFKNLVFAGSFNEAENMIEAYKNECITNKGYCENAEIYWLLLLTSKKVCDNDELIAKKEDISRDTNYKMAIANSKGVERDKYENVSRAILGLPLIEIVEVEEETEKEVKKKLTETQVAQKKEENKTTTTSSQTKTEEQTTKNIKVEDIDDVLDFHISVLRPAEKLSADVQTKNSMVIDYDFSKYFDNPMENIDLSFGVENEDLNQDLILNDKDEDVILDDKKEDLDQDLLQEERNETVTENLNKTKQYKAEDFILEGDKLIKYNGEDEILMLPEEIKIIGEFAFADCVSIKEITLPLGLEEIQRFAFENCLSLSRMVIPKGVKVIEEYAFSCCENLENVILPNDLTEIRNNVFENCYKLKEINLPEQLIVIGDLAFFGCRNLVSIDIPASVDTIGRKAFASCICLESVHLAMNNNLQWMCEDVFVNCSKFIDINIEDIESWCKIQHVAKSENEFFRYSDMNLNLNGKPIENLEIPEGITFICNNAFLGYEKLKSVKFPSTLLEIGVKAFAYCVSLETVDFDQEGQLENIGEYAFYKCGELREIDFPESLWSIKNYAFYDCLALERAIIPSQVTFDEYERNTFPEMTLIEDK